MFHANDHGRWNQARSQDLEKGGLFWKRRKVQTTLTRIFIVLESVSHNLSENWDEISRKARKFKGFSAQNQVVSKKKKKGLHRNWDWFFGQNRKFKRLRGGCFPMGGGGYFQFFTKNRSQKHQKRAILHTSQANGGGLEPPLATLLVGIKVRGKGTEYSGSEFFGGPVLVEACTYNSGETQAQNLSKELCFLIFTQNLKEKQAQFEWRHFLCFLWCSSKSEG